MISDERILEAVRRRISLEETQDPRGYVTSTLQLTDGHGEAVLEISQTSLRARRDLLELVLVDMMREVLTCERCGTRECLRHDQDLCTVVQVMGS